MSAQPQETPTSTQSGWFRPHWLVAPLVLAAFALAPSAPWLWDDLSLAEQWSGTRLDDLPGLVAGPYLGEYWRPLTVGLLWLEIVGLESPAVAHTVSLSLHLLNAWLLSRWLRLHSVPTKVATALAGAWAVLPSICEVTYWVCCQADLLATAGGLVALIGAERFRRRATASSAAMIGLGLLVGLGAKEVAVALVPVLALTLWRRSPPPDGTVGESDDPPSPGPDSAAPAVLRHGAVVGVAVLAGLWWSVRLGQLSGLAPSSAPSWSVVERAELVLAALGTAFSRLAWPWTGDLAVGVQSLPQPRLLVALGVMTLVGAMLVALRATGRTRYAVLVAGVLLAPSIHLVPLSVNPLLADRYLYFPAACLTLALASPIVAATRLSPSVARVIGPVVLVCLAACTFARGSVWRDSEQFLWTLVAEADARNGQPALVAGALLANQGRCAEASPLLASAAEKLDAGGWELESSEAAIRLAECRLVAGDAAAAVELTRAHRRPDSVFLDSIHVRALMENGDLDDAARAAGALSVRHPESATGPALRSEVAARQLDFRVAESALLEARRRVGMETPSPLSLRLREAAAEADAARELWAGGDEAGARRMVALAEEWNAHAAAEVWRRRADSAQQQ